MAQVPSFGFRFISRAVKTENPVPRSFFAPKPNGNACYAGYLHGQKKQFHLCVRCEHQGEVKF